jgi:hypothetical protein
MEIYDWSTVGRFINKTEKKIFFKNRFNRFFFSQKTGKKSGKYLKLAETAHKA